MAEFNEVIQSVVDSIEKKKVQSYGKKVLKKYSFKSYKDLQNLSGLALWLYVYRYYEETLMVCDLVSSIEFTGNYTLWGEVDTLYCIKARILRERGEVQEAQKNIEFVNQYRSPNLYVNLVDWFQNTLDRNIRNGMEQFRSKATEISWREVKLECAIKYREAGQFPISDDELENIIREQIEILSQVK